MSRRGSGRAAAALRRGYKDAALAGNWVLCKLIAERMRGLDDDGAEVTYAMAYAHEQLGELDDARSAYEMVLRIDSRHVRARARLRTLAIKRPPPSQ